MGNIVCKEEKDGSISEVLWYERGDEGGIFPQNKVQDGYITSGWPQGSYTPDVPKKSLYNHFVYMINENLKEGDWVWLRNYITKEDYMASDFEKHAKKFAVILEGLGFGHDDKIHACVGNHNYLFSLYGGAWILGGVVSGGDVALDAEAIANQLIDLDAKVVVCTAATSLKVCQAAKEAGTKLGHDVKVVSFGKVEGVMDIVALLNETDGLKAPVPVEFPDEELKKRPALVMWTSGTTGLPKGICHTHFSAWNYVHSCPKTMKRNTNYVTTNCFFHPGGFIMGTMAGRLRQTCYYMFGEGLTLKTILEALKESRCVGACLGSHHFVQLSESKEFKNADPDDFNNIELILPTGTAVPNSCRIPYKAKFKNLKLVMNVYGMSEAGLSLVSGTQEKLGYIIPGNTIKIRCTGSGKIMGPNETGEICVKNEHIMLRYLKRPEATKEFFDHEGFACTGDLGYFDDLGAVYYVDRIKELIKFKNNHVSPTEIEAILQDHPSVQESLVFGFENPEVQELISAVVVVNPGQTLTEQEVLDHVNSRVIDYKKIRGPVLFRDRISRNKVGKLLRREMRVWARNDVKTKSLKLTSDAKT